MIPQIVYSAYVDKLLPRNKQTNFVIQFGRNIKASFKTEIIIVGDMDKALKTYKSFAIDSGQKKRVCIVMPDGTLKVLERKIAE